MKHSLRYLLSPRRLHPRSLFLYQTLGSPRVPISLVSSSGHRQNVREVRSLYPVVHVSVSLYSLAGESTVVVGATVDTRYPWARTRPVPVTGDPTLRNSLWCLSDAPQWDVREVRRTGNRDHSPVTSVPETVAGVANV